MAHLPASTANEFRIDHGLVQDTIRAGVTPKRARAHDLHWERWESFCYSLDVDPFVRDFDDAVPLLQVLGQRYRDGRLAPNKHPVRARTVEDALRAVGQKFSSLGAKDIRHNQAGNNDFRIVRQIGCWKKQDSPPTRVKPVPITMILHLIATAFGAARITSTMAVVDMIIIAFYFLLRPGEYTGTSIDDAPFLLEDVGLYVGRDQLDLFTAPIGRLQSATSASLTFTDKKNGNQN